MSGNTEKKWLDIRGNKINSTMPSIKFDIIQNRINMFTQKEIDMHIDNSLTLRMPNKYGSWAIN